MASVGSQLITHFNAATRGANRGKNDHGVPVVFLLLSMEPNNYDSSVSSTAQNNGFTLRGLDAQTNRTSGVRAGVSFFNGFSASTTPSNLGIANRRQIAILNGVRNSPGKQYLQILVNDHPDGALNTTEAAAMRAAINGVQPAPVNTAPQLIGDPSHAVLRSAVCSPYSFSVSDAESGPDPLIVTAVSSDQTLLPNAGIMHAGAGAERDVKFSPAPGRTGTAVITITVSDGTLSTQRQVTLTVTDPYETWAATQGLTAGNRAHHLDPDGDSLTNLQEYFHGTSSLSPNAGPVVVMQNGGPHFTFQRNESAAFQPWVMEAGPDAASLVPWTAAAANVTATSAGGIETISVRLPSTGRWFVRLRIAR